MPAVKRHYGYPNGRRVEARRGPGQQRRQPRKALRAGWPDRHRKQGYGPFTIACHSQPIIGDVTADIGGSVTTDAVTGNMSRASVSLARTWSARNVTISRAGARKPVTDSFAKLVAIGLVYRIMVILFGSLLVPVVILCALPLAVTGAFVTLAVTGRAGRAEAAVEVHRDCSRVYHQPPATA
jgi:hypothetical protein